MWDFLLIIVTYANNIFPHVLINILIFIFMINIHIFKSFITIVILKHILALRIYEEFILELGLLLTSLLPLKANVAEDAAHEGRARRLDARARLRQA